MIPRPIISGELLSGVVGLISATLLSRPVAKLVLSLHKHRETPSPVIGSDQALSQKALKETYDNVHSAATGAGLLFAVLDVVFIKQISFIIFFLCLMVPYILSYVMYPKALYLIGVDGEPLLKEDQFELEEKLGLLFMLLGGMITLGTAYYQSYYYGPHNLKGSLLYFLGFALSVLSLYGLGRRKS